MRDAHLTEADTLALVRGEPVSADSLGHLDRCSDCAKRVREQQEVWNTLGSLDPGPRSEALWDGIEAHLTPHAAKRRPVIRLPWAMAAALVLSLGLGASWQLFSLRARIASLEQANSELALGHNSASMRLTALADLPESPREQATIDVLLSLLRADPDEHVRLLALEALQGPLESGTVTPRALVEILAMEKSPLVQTDLIVSILGAGGPGMLPAIRNVLPQDSIHPFVSSQLIET
ncbi:MAG: hypothetical protein HKO65_05800 [Gemmatimonadetes bacterium]|nr:hypothetical protein [Gemmatimonadota bacterium]NNM04599.1 hypothetical protein [Gemmatimonadota bacterium]